MKKLAILGIVALFVLGMVMSVATVAASPTTYDTYWELTSHPKPGEFILDPTTATPSWSDLDLGLVATGNAVHAQETFQDYPSYTFTKNYVEVYNKKADLYTWKGCTMEYYWMSDWTLLAADDVDSYIAANEGVTVLYHMKDYRLGVSIYGGDADLEWSISRQYTYWLQTEYTAATFGFTEDIGDRIHAEWDEDEATYNPSDSVWLALSTYFTIPLGDDLTTYYDAVGLPMSPIYDAFPDEYKGHYNWLP